MNSSKRFLQSLASTATTRHPSLKRSTTFIQQHPLSYHDQNQKLQSSFIAIPSVWMTNEDTITRTLTSSSFKPIRRNRTRRFTKMNNENPNTPSKQKKKKDKKKYQKNTNKISQLVRADRVLSERGMGTRSETFRLLRSKRITMLRPNNNNTSIMEKIVVAGPSQRIHPQSKLFLDGQEIAGPAPLLLVYHKPKFMLSTMKSIAKGEQQEERRCLGDVLQTRYIKSGMHPVGRLDYDSSGLILFSSDGTLTQWLLHPKRKVEKEYVARVEGQISDSDQIIFKEKLEVEGVETTMGKHLAKLLSLNPVLHNEEMTDVRLVVWEGKHRMVRRMLANCGYPVVELRRERHGEISLGGLKVGEFRDLSEEELIWARSLLGKKKKK